ncbi:MAG: heavy metal translocating P-type ATPase [Erysipelotrichaceae bacterium]
MLIKKLLHSGCHGSCGSEHHKNEMNLKLFSIRLVCATILMLLAIFCPLESIIRLSIFLIAYGLAGYEVLLSAFKNILQGKVFDENFLMSVASIGAFAIGEMAEGVAVMIFYGAGELLQEKAVARSKSNITELMDIRPDMARVKKGDLLEEVNPETVKIGNIIVVKPGEKIALDGTIIKGSSYINNQSLTGESKLIKAEKGTTVLSGSISTDGLIEIEVTKEYSESTVAKILELVETASTNKATSEKFITKFAKIYTPIVVYLAIIIAIIPPMIGWGSLSDWIYTALTFLIISCPCALVISIPAAFFGGIGSAARQGILIKGANHLEALNSANEFVFDKTGTLTKGVFAVKDIITNNISKEELLEIAAIAESNSNHPIAKSIIKAYNKQIDYTNESEEIAGKGLKTLINKQTIYLGNITLMADIGIKNLEEYPYTSVYVARDSEYLGVILIADLIKENTKTALTQLKQLNTKEFTMLTGDNKNTANLIAEELAIDKYYAELLPQDKVNKIEEIIAHKKASDKVVFVGDGINDAPVLIRSDIGIAMGEVGSDAAIEAADIVIMNDDLNSLVKAKKIAHKTRRIVSQNICFSLGFKIFVMLLALFNMTSIWMAIFADVGVSLLAILNATRLLRYTGD